MLRFHWTAYLVTKAAVLLGVSAYACDPVGVVPGVLSLAFAPVVALFERLR